MGWWCYLVVHELQVKRPELEYLVSLFTSCEILGGLLNLY
jgi:hypothetical protein